MVVAVTIVRMVQMSIDNIVNVVAMRNSFVSAARTVNMSCIVSATCVLWSTYFGIGSIDI